MKSKANSSPDARIKLWVPRMSTVGAECLSAALRSIGFDARVSPEADEQTLLRAAKFTTGEECLPQRVVLGNFLKVIQDKDFDPEQNGFFMPTSSGPCRFGQYAPFQKKVLKEIGLDASLIFSPTSSNGYEGIARNVNKFKRTAWRAVIVSDILRKAAYMVRPYELRAGETDQVQKQYQVRLCSVLEDSSLSVQKQIRLLIGHLKSFRDAITKIPLREPLGSRPLIGIVGEIYLRLNSFSNQNLVRRVEAQGGECWMANVAEWVWYTHVEQQRKLMDDRRQLSAEMLGAKIREWIQHSDEKKLLEPFDTFFQTRPDVSIRELLRNSEKYLPQRKALGEMTLNSGNAIAYYQSGCDGIIDISPFTCMNGIVTETYYYQISQDHDDIPIRIFYFDGVPFDLDSDLEIFMELVKSYRKKKLTHS